MAVPESTVQAPSPTEEAYYGSLLGERVARLEGAYEHLATKADVHAVRADIEKARTEVESVRTEVESLKAGHRATRWMIGIMIGLSSVGVAAVNFLVALALRS